MNSKLKELSWATRLALVFGRIPATERECYVLLDTARTARETKFESILRPFKGIRRGSTLWLDAAARWATLKGDEPSARKAFQRAYKLVGWCTGTRRLAEIWLNHLTDHRSEYTRRMVYNLSTCWSDTSFAHAMSRRAEFARAFVREKHPTVQSLKLAINIAPRSSAAHSEAQEALRKLRTPVA
jgi:hypothetical protein